MNEQIKLGVLLVVVLAVAGFMGYKIYLNYKNTDPKDFNVLTVLSFVLNNIEYFVDALQDAMGDLNGVSADGYENDEEYHDKLLNVAITIIEERAAEVGITFKLSHATLVNIADIAIHQIIKFIEQTEKEKMLMDSRIIDENVSDEKQDMTKTIEGWYDE